MKKLFAVLAVLAMISAMTPAPAQAGPVMRDMGQGCAFGAAVLAATTVMGLTAVALSVSGPGATVVPQATTALVNNSLIGCGLGVVGSLAGKIMGGLYDILF